uniref:Transgelin n=1 Tax=Syphacia muris TaxID=451379 RepID=A0A0N5AHM7_9BILA
MLHHSVWHNSKRHLQNQARFNIDEAQEVLLWMEQVTGFQFEMDPNVMQNAQDVANALKDGVQLCALMNRLKDKSVTYNPRPKMPFHKMENISFFLEAAKAYGVPEISCFQTVDLYENKQCYKVIECLRALAAVAQSKNAPVIFPAWVVKLSQSRPRVFPESVIRRGEMVIPLQYGTNKCASQKGMTPYGLTRQIKPEN